MKKNYEKGRQKNLQKEKMELTWKNRCMQLGKKEKHVNITNHGIRMIGLLLIDKIN